MEIRFDGGTGDRHRRRSRHRSRHRPRLRCPGRRGPGGQRQRRPGLARPPTARRPAGRSRHPSARRHRSRGDRPRSRPSARLDPRPQRRRGAWAGPVGRSRRSRFPSWNAILEVSAVGLPDRSGGGAVMRAAGRGRIVTISSGAGTSASAGNIQAYAAAKTWRIGPDRRSPTNSAPSASREQCRAGLMRSNPTTERRWEAYGEEAGASSRCFLRRTGTSTTSPPWFCSWRAATPDWITGQVISNSGGGA